MTDFPGRSWLLMRRDIEHKVSAAGIGSRGPCFECGVDKIFPGNSPLLLLYQFQLSPQTLHKTADRIQQKGDEVAAGLAGPVQLTVILRACLIVVVAEQMRPGLGTPEATSRTNSTRRAVRPFPSPNGCIHAI